MLKVGTEIIVNDKMQSGYSYVIAVPMGQRLGDGFRPHFTPKQMLAMGVFEGKYMNDCQDEFPADWFEGTKISAVADVNCNYFKIKSRQPLAVWQENGWIMGDDPRGWFQWYCRYYLGRREPAIDEVQKKRWRAFSRHAGQIRSNCEIGDLNCRPRQRQGLLQWAHDCFI